LKKTLQNRTVVRNEGDTKRAEKEYKKNMDAGIKMHRKEMSRKIKKIYDRIITKKYWNILSSRYQTNKGNNKITEHRTIFQRERQNSYVNKQTKSVNNRNSGKTAMALTWYRHFQRNGGR
jgi:GTP-sensing pleiotropic transcriptional regulator CodY